MPIQNPIILTHEWEDRVGRPPYRLIGVLNSPNPATFGQNTDGYNNACRDFHEYKCGIERKYGQSLDGHLGFCDICGHDLMNNYVMVNADGKLFNVGSDCVLKSSNSQLISQIKHEIAKKRKEQAKVKRQAAWEAGRPERERRIAERNAIEEQKRKEREAEQAKTANANQWLVDCLRDNAKGPWVDSMVSELQKGRSLKSFSDKCLNIFQDIYSRQAGRRNSAGYQAKSEEFDQLLENSL